MTHTTTNTSLLANTTIPTPLADAYRAAHEAARAADAAAAAAYFACECAGCRPFSEDTPTNVLRAHAERGCAAARAYLEAIDPEAAAAPARKAWIDSDEPRAWEFRDGTGSRDRGAMKYVYRPSEVEAELAKWAMSGWDDVEETMWIHPSAWSIDPVTEELTDQEVSARVTIEATEPACEDGHDHDWRSPYEVLGGLRENPGVSGHGGGVITREVCAHCGRYRVIDTWAQDMTTGEQGLRSTSYEPADDASRAWIAGDEEDELEDDAEDGPAHRAGYDV